MQFSSLLLSIAITASPLSQLPARAAKQATVGGAVPLALGPTCESRTPIRTLPYTIISSGSYYVAKALTGTSGSSGITIAASATDVTIDLNGFTLSGVPGSLRGITQGAAGQNVTVVNGTVRDWGQEGIYLPGTAAVHVENLTAAANGATAGLVLGGSGSVKCVVADGNTGSGMIFGSSTTENHFVVTDSVASFNGAHGFINTQTGGAPDSFSFDTCIAKSNGSVGFSVSQASVRGCSAYQNGTDGFSLVSCTAENSVGRENGNDGFNIFASVVSNCVAANNVGDGFDLLRLNQVRECNASNNGGNGILCTNERNLIDSNLLVLNVGFGVVSTDTSNTIIRNTSVDNTVGAYSASGARFGPVQSPSTATSPWANF